MQKRGNSSFIYSKVRPSTALK